MYKAELLHSYDNYMDHRTLDIDGLQLGGQVGNVTRARWSSWSPGSTTDPRLLPIQLLGEAVRLGLELVPQTQQLGVSEVNWVLGPHPGVPPAVVTLPELHVPGGLQQHISISVRHCPLFTLPDGGHGKQGLVLIQRSAVHRVQVDCSLAVDQGPEGLSSVRRNERLAFHWLVFLFQPGLQLGLLPFLVAIIEESSEQTGIQMVQNRGQEIFVELKCVGELLRHL